MTEEIKEILEDIKNTEECSLSGKNALFLLDYITNLQQENEKLKYNARGQVNDYFKDKYADEVLKNAELKKENKRLNSNQDKVIKYIDEHTLFVNGGIIKNILNGSDKSE